MNKTILGAIAYAAVTFPLAAIWHAVILKDMYTGFGYFEGEPDFLLGFVTIVVQGGVLSYLYPLVKLNGIGVTRGLKYAAIIGLFFWSSHVLAFVAKQTVPNAMHFVALETLYLVIQFGGFGICVGLLHRSTLRSET